MPLSLYPHLTGRVLTSERRKRRCRKSLMHPNDRRIDTETRSTQRSKEVHHIKRVKEELLTVTAHPPLQPTVDAVSDLSGSRVKVLFGQNGVFLAIVADDEDRWECVAELQDAGCTDESCQVGDLWDGASDDKSQTPVDGDDCYPSPLSDAVV